MTKLDLNGMRDDAEHVLRAVERDPHSIRDGCPATGGAKGSVAGAAVTHPELAGTIFQGLVALSWR